MTKLLLLSSFGFFGLNQLLAFRVLEVKDPQEGLIKVVTAGLTFVTALVYYFLERRKKKP